MKIYEMIFHKGEDESMRIFYSVNDKISRQHFIDLIRTEINDKLKDFKLSCIEYDLLTLFEDIYKEQSYYLDIMEMDFIKNEFAIFDQFVSLIVEEREVKIINNIKLNQ